MWIHIRQYTSNNRRRMYESAWRWSKTSIETLRKNLKIFFVPFGTIMRITVLQDYNGLLRSSPSTFSNTKDSFIRNLRNVISSDFSPLRCDDVQFGREATTCRRNLLHHIPEESLIWSSSYIGRHIRSLYSAVSPAEFSLQFWMIWKVDNPSCRLETGKKRVAAFFISCHLAAGSGEKWGRPRKSLVGVDCNQDEIRTWTYRVHVLPSHQSARYGPKTCQICRFRDQHIK
jgi:hypothetical protein